MQGRRLKGGNSGQEAIAIKADNGDTSTANSATPFLEFTNAKIDGTDKDGRTNLTKYNVDSLTPGGSDVQGVLISINAVKYWVPVFKAD